MASSTAARIRRIANKIRRLPDKFPETGILCQWEPYPGLVLEAWVGHEGGKLLFAAFKLGAFGGPATKPWPSSMMKLRTTKEASIEECQKDTEEWEKQVHKERLSIPGAKATDAKRRTYAGMCLASFYKRPRKPPTRPHVIGAFSREAWGMLWDDVGAGARRMHRWGTTMVSNGRGWRPR